MPVTLSLSAAKDPVSADNLSNLVCLTRAASIICCCSPVVYLLPSGSNTSAIRYSVNWHVSSCSWVPKTQYYSGSMS